MSRLNAAAKSGEVLDIVYHGGSQPGSQRRVAPISISGNKLWARCFPQNVVKSFSVSKISFPGQNVVVPTHDPNLVPTVLYQTLDDFLAANLLKLEAVDWHVTVEHKPDSDDVRVGAYAKLKNGSTRKHPAWALSYETHRLDDAGMVERQRKWLVAERNRSVKSFYTLDKAAAFFMQSAVPE